MLREKLEKMANASAQRSSEEIKTIMNNGLNRLIEGDYEKQAFNVGDKVPDCEIKNHRGETVKIYELMSGRPGIITFYRGGW